MSGSRFGWKLGAGLGVLAVAAAIVLARRPSDNHGPTTAASASAPPVVSGAPRRFSVADEVIQIDAARTALERGDKAGALRILDVYDGRFPHGALASQAAALRARARP